MKKTNQRWKISLGLLLSLAAGSMLAVNPDYAPNIPCWRDGSNSTRQVWTFDVTGSFSNAIAPEFKTNQPGNPTVIFIKGTQGQGWYTSGGGTNIVTAVLPYQFGADEPTPPAYSTQYKSIQFGYGVGCADPPDCTTPIPYDPPPNPTGTAQGYWDVGGSGNKILVSIPNSGAPAGTLRYFFIQGTYNVNDSAAVAGLPSTFSVTNNVGTGTELTTLRTTNLVEHPLDANGQLQSTPWKNHRRVMRISADTVASNDVVAISRTSQPMWVDALIIETLDRVAQADALNAALNTPTNIPFAALLANDRGGSLISVGSATNCTISTNAGNVVSFTGTNAGTATFWYTNQDCMGLTNLGAQVTVTVQVANQPPVAGNDTVSRPKGASLKIKLSDLLANDSDTDGGTLVVTNITLVTTNGVTLYSNANLLVYSNSVTPDANDRFSYTITDGQGGSATAFVFINVIPATNSVATGSITVSGGAVNLVFHGIPGQSYGIQRSTNSGSIWTTFTNKVANTGAPVGQINVTDTFEGVSPIPSSAMYRMIVP